MDRNSIIGILLLVAIFIGFTWMQQPSEEERLANQKKQERIDSLKRVQAEQDSARTAMIEDEIEEIDDLAITADSLPTSDTTAQVISKKDRKLQKKYGVFYHATHGEDQDIVLENKFVKLTISSLSGAITSAEVKDYVTYDSLPLVLFTKETSNFSFLLDYTKQIQSKDLYFEPVFENNAAENIFVAEGQRKVLKMRLYPRDGQGKKLDDSYMEYEYILTGDDYMVDFNLNLHEMGEYVSRGYDDMMLFWDQNLKGMEKSVEQELQQTTIYYKYKDEDVEDLGLRSKDDKSEELSTHVSWVSHKQQFFTSTLISKNYFAKGDVSKKTIEESNDPRYLTTMSTELVVPIGRGEQQGAQMQFYFGPNKYKILKEYEMDLEQLIPLGWGFLLHYINRFAVIPVFDFLSQFGWNIGIIILVLTILLKLVLFPIAYKTYQSSAKMRVLKPEVDEINNRYPKKEDAVKKQQATMELYKKAGANPMSGCLPMLLQMPILIAMFRFFPASIELRQKSFLWADDMSAYDSIWNFPNEFTIPFYGDHVSLFTLLMTVTTIFYTRINNQMMGNSSQQLPGMKTMMYFNACYVLRVLQQLRSWFELLLFLGQRNYLYPNVCIPLFNQ